MEEEYPIHIIRAFLNNYYDSIFTDALLRELYKNNIKEGSLIID